MSGIEGTRTLSTGHAVSLPLRCEADVAGATFTARWRRLDAVVPDGLDPIRVAPRSGLVTLVGVRYRFVEGFEPYEEFAVVVPVARRTVGGRGVPSRGAAVGGYVHALPVTTEASKTLGREIWSYPKTVAEISVRELDGAVRTTVDSDRDGDGTTATTLTVRDGRALPLDVRATSYSVREGALCRAPIDLLGEIRVGIGGARLNVGDGAVGTTLGGLGIGRPVGRFVARRLDAHVHAPRAVADATIDE